MCEVREHVLIHAVVDPLQSCLQIVYYGTRGYSVVTYRCPVSGVRSYVCYVLRKLNVNTMYYFCVVPFAVRASEVVSHSLLPIVSIVVRCRARGTWGPVYCVVMHITCVRGGSGWRLGVALAVRLRVALPALQGGGWAMRGWAPGPRPGGFVLPNMKYIRERLAC